MNIALQAPETQTLLRQNAIINKQKLWDLKQQPCGDCKLRWHPSCMSLDHVGRAPHNYPNIANVTYWEPDIFDHELSKCEVVCKNCHIIRELKRDISNPTISKYRKEEVKKLINQTVRGGLLEEPK